MEKPSRVDRQEPGQRSRTWSVLDGRFEPSPDFPNRQRIKIIEDMSAVHIVKEMQRRVYYTELLIFALKYVNPAIENDSDLVGQIRRGLIDQTVDTITQMGELHRKEDIKQIAEERIDEPMGPAVEIPVMQALRAMQEAGAINYETRTMLDAIVRGVHIKQSASKL